MTKILAFVLFAALAASACNLVGQGASFGVLNALDYCSTPSVLDQTCVQNAVAAATAGQMVYVPAGSYSGTTSTIAQSNVALVLDPGANLNYTLNLSGQGYYRSNTVSSFGTYSAGSTVFMGNFSAYSPGQTVLIEQVNPTSANQIGLELATVSSASGTQLVLTTATRYSYSAPNISVTTAALRASGVTGKGSLTISGNYTGILAVGNLVRVENTTGTDDAAGDTNYFEILRVASINSTAVTFESSTHASYGNPWLIKLNSISNVSVKGNGGYIGALYASYVDRLSTDDLYTASYSAIWAYDVKVGNIRGATNQPVAVGLTFVYHGTLSNILAYGAASSTDNGNVKIGQCDDLAISNVSTWWGTASAQGTYPFMIDFDYTPYNPWNGNITVSGITAGLTNSGVSVYLGGLRDSTINGITSPGFIEFLASSSVVGSSISTTGQLIFRSGSGYILNDVAADSISIGDDGPATNSQLSNFKIAGGTSADYARSVWIRNTSTNWRFVHGEFAASTNISYYINDTSENNIWLEDIQDAPLGGADSVYNPYSAALYFGPNRFAGPVITAPTTITIPGGLSVGLVRTTGSAPSVSAGTLTGTNAGGYVSGLNVAGTITITFANGGWTNWASCTANTSSSSSQAYVAAINKTAVVFNFGPLTGTLYYHCDGN